MIIDGKALSAKIKEDLKIEVENLNSKGIYPSLAVVLVGNDPASEVYVRNKAIGCEKVGIKSYTYKLPENSSTEEVFELLVLNKSTKEISDYLGICEKTIRNHISNVMQKLNVKNRSSAIIELLKLNEISI